MPLWTFFLTFFFVFGFDIDRQSLARPAARAAAGAARRRRLLAQHALARSLARARVRVRPLPAHRKAAPVAQPAIAAEVHEALDVHRHLAPQIALDLVLGLEDIADAADLVLVEVVGPLVERDVSLLQDLARERLADPVDVSERDFHPLVAREVDACD